MRLSSTKLCQNKTILKNITAFFFYSGFHNLQIAMVFPNAIVFILPFLSTFAVSCLADAEGDEVDLLLVRSATVSREINPVRFKINVC